MKSLEGPNVGCAKRRRLQETSFDPPSDVLLERFLPKAVSAVPETVGVTT